MNDPKAQAMKLVMLPDTDGDGKPDAPKKSESRLECPKCGHVGPKDKFKPDED